MRRVIDDPMPFKERTVFACKAVFSMMMFLVSDIITNLGVGVRCDAEGPVSMLPVESTAVRKGVVNPF